MEQQVDIFKEGEVLNGTFYSFKEFGDKVQGTYIDLKEGPGYLGKGTQLQYWIRVADGSVQIIGGKDSINRQMENVKFGQIVGFSYVKDIPTKNGGKPFHQIDVYSRPDLRDEAWLKTHKRDGLLDTVLTKIEVGMTEDDYGEYNVDSEADVYIPGVKEDLITEADIAAAFDSGTPKSPTQEPFLTASEEAAILKEISALAKTKCGSIDIDEVKKHVIEVTGLAFAKSNLGVIVEKMRAL